MYCAFCGNRYSGGNICPRCGRYNGGKENNTIFSIGTIVAFISIVVGVVGTFLPYVSIVGLSSDLWGDSFDIERINALQLLAIGVIFGMLLEFGVLMDKNNNKHIFSIIIGAAIVVSNIGEYFYMIKVLGMQDELFDINLRYWISLEVGFYILLFSGVGLIISGLIMIYERNNYQIDNTYINNVLTQPENHKTVNENPQNPMLKRVYMMLEDGDWDKADDLCEQMLNADPENAEVYLAKLMIDYKSNHLEDLSKGDVAFDDNDNYKKILRFGDNNLIKLLKECNSVIKERIALDNLSTPEEIYECAYNFMISAQNEDEYNKAISLFGKIREYNDSEERIERCKEVIEEKNNKYNKAKNFINKKTVDGYKLALSILKDIDGWKDSNNLVVVCQKRIDDYNDEKERIEALHTKKEKQKNIIKSVAITSAVVLFTIVIICLVKNKIAERIIEKRKMETLSVYQNKDVGDSFSFGIYEQDNNLNNGKEPIEWIVINKTNDKILVISKYILDYERFYNATNQDISNNNINLWFNEFKDEAFSECEIELILDNENNDKIFFLNSNDIKKLGENIQCENTDYVRSKRKSIFTYGDWWLEGTESTLNWISSDGKSECFHIVKKRANDFCLTEEAFLIKGVRPCMWLSLQ